MKRVSVLAFVVALSACGAAQSWSGTYTGTSKRAAALNDVESAAPVNETWTVTEHSSTQIEIVRRREGDDPCTLRGSHGSDRAGGYGMTLDADQLCVFGGKMQKLIKGDLREGSSYDFEFEWRAESGGESVYERGTLSRN